MQKIFIKICLIVSVLCLSISTLLTIIFSFTIGNIIAFVAGLFFLCLYLIYPRLRSKSRIILNVFLIGIAVFAFSIFLTIGRHSVKNTTTFTEDYALVLGCGIRGEEVLPTLKFRLDKCLDYLQHNPNAMVIVSGGLGRGQIITESEAMKRYLVSKGVEADRIIEENQSKNTRQNMQFSKAILDARFPSNDYSVVCITSGYHAFRAGKLSKKAGLSVSHYNARKPWYLYPVAYCTETLSIIKMWTGL